MAQGAEREEDKGETAGYGWLFGGIKIKKVIAVMVVVSVLAVITYFFYFVSEEYVVPKLPINSKAETVIVTSNGCCLWTDNIVVSVLDDNGYETVLFSCPSVYEHDIFESKLPDVDDSPLRLKVELVLEYGQRKEFSFEVMEYANNEELKRDGVLIYIQEADGAYINIISGDSRISYKENYDGLSWMLMDEQKQVYP